MKKMLILLAVATIPATLSGCAACCPTAGLCPCCPCNWFAPEPACPPAPLYAAPLVANPCAPPPCGPAAVPQMMPQYVSPTMAPFAAAPSPCSTCGPQGMVMPQPQMQPMFAPPQQFSQADPTYYAEPSCGCGYAESGCGMPSMMGYGGMPVMAYGPFDCGACSGGCCDGGALGAPSPEGYVTPAPGE